MNTEELLALSQWIDKEVKGRKIVPLYSQLVEILQNNAHSTPSQPFSVQKDQLIAALSAVDLLGLSHEQLGLLQKLGLAAHLGQEGAQELESLLIRSGLDISSAWSRTQQIRDEVQNGISRSDQIKASLSDLISLAETPEDRAIVRVSFEGAASIENVVDLKKWANEWHDIARGIAMSRGAAPEAVEVIGAHKGSIIVVLATTYAIAQTLGVILSKSLEVAQKVLTIQKTAQEIRSLKLSNDKIARELEASIQEERAAGIEKISSEVASAAFDSNDLNGEKLVALEGSVKKLIAFIEKGGQVDLLLPMTSDDGDAEAGEANGELQELREKIREIRALEAEVKQLEHMTRKGD